MRRRRLLTASPCADLWKAAPLPYRAGGFRVTLSETGDVTIRKGQCKGMKLSASKFAEASGLSVVTIGRYCKNGKISAEKTHDGKGWVIDASELDRLNLKPTQKPEMLGSETLKETGENSGLQRLVETLQQELDRMRDERAELKADHAEALADARKDRDLWREEAQAMRRMLPPPSAPETPVTGQGKPVGGFWARLLGKGAANE